MESTDYAWAIKSFASGWLCLVFVFFFVLLLWVEDACAQQHPVDAVDCCFFGSACFLGCWLVVACFTSSGELFFFLLCLYFMWRRELSIVVSAVEQA